MYRVVSAVLPTWHMMLSGLLPWDLTGIFFATLSFIPLIRVFALFRALVSISSRGLQLENFNYTTNGRLITDLITAQLNRSDFAFTGVSVSK